MKILIACLFGLLIANSFFSWFLWKENQRNRQNIGFLENKMDRLDIDSLEKIRSKANTDIDCSSTEPGDWLKSSICN
ncbi:MULTISPECIES: hypothetical protein [unclassified Acinetobacter]|jgi:hypothetical protein|uniref:hypothetical protein n=1 Tax=unclassified Acinetobacter TaxID=196816 RepID=UPI0015D40527|nr:MULTISPECIES: hypothetical protein [unclassified Acinetobacter]